jgi:hypothetical protein
MPENIQWSSIDIDSIPLLEKNWTKCIDEAEDNNDGWKTVVRCAHNRNTLSNVMELSSVPHGVAPKKDLDLKKKLKKKELSLS